MSNTKFTPGPWAYKQYQKGVWGVGDPNTNDQIAKLEWNKEYDSEAGANAALIAAAPELYAELQKSVEQMLIGLTAVQKLIEKSGTAEVLSKAEKEMMTQIRNANAALAKARGENTIDP